VIFELETTAHGEYAGVAPRRDCRKADGSSIEEGDLPGEGYIPGRVVARLIGNGGEAARVALPDGEAVVVAFSLVTERQGACLTAKWNMPSGAAG
jgi:hypothetical protein